MNLLKVSPKYEMDIQIYIIIIYRYSNMLKFYAVIQMTGHDYASFFLVCELHER